MKDRHPFLLVVLGIEFIEMHYEITLTFMAIYDAFDLLILKVTNV